MNFKPLRDYSEHDVNNFFKLNTATGAKATPVVINGSGWNHNQKLVAAVNLAAGNDNINSPRWAVQAEVRAAVSGEKPFGLTLYDTREYNQWNYPLIYDKQRRIEAQAVVSGQAVPIVRKGMFTVGPFQTGEVPAPGKYAVVRGTGEIGVGSATSGVAPAGAFGEFIGTKDNDGYAVVYINCYL